MTEDAANQLMQLLSALVNNSRENALKLKALDRLVNNRPDIFQDYQDYVEQLRGDPKTQKAVECNAEVLDKLRRALRRE